MKRLLSSEGVSLANYPVLFLFVILLVLTGCRTNSSSKKYVIGFSQCVESDAWRKTMLEEMKREISFYPNVEFIYRQADGNSEKQISQVKELLTEAPDILIISPNEADPLTPIVEETFNKGIPVIVVDRKISSPSYTSFVGSDNFQIGKMAGEYAVNLLKGKGNIIEITGLLKSTPAIERDRGFTEAIKSFPSIKIVQKVNGEWYRQKAKEEMSKVAGNTPDVHLVFAQNDMMAYSAYEVYKEKGSQKPKIIGVDGLPCDGCGMQFVFDRSITATMLYPTGGEEAIRLAIKILNKEHFKKENNLQTTVIDSTNVKLMQLQANKISTQQQSIERQQNMLGKLVTIYSNQRTFSYILIFLLLAAIALGGIVFFSLRRNRKINKQLQLRNQEILEQKDKIEEISAKAQESNEAKVNFFTNISHEFRTPLALILAPLEELLTNTKNQTQLQGLNLIHKNVFRLFRLVNQLLDFRKIEVERMKVRATENDIVSFVDDIIHSYKSIAQKRNIDLRLVTSERQVNIWFDASMIDKVIFNLLSNAFKFTPDGGFIYIYLDKNGESKEVTIRVEDNGVGMTKEAVERVFEAFYQGENENYRGSGLGLALSKELIKLHKAAINAKSEKGKGTTFEVRLRIGKDHFSPEQISEGSPTLLPQYEQENIYTSDLEDQQRMTWEASSDVSAKEYSILIIEDNPELRGFLADRLSTDYDILEAENGQAGLQQAFDSVPDLIITDIVIPGKDGLSITHTLKNDIRTSHIPIVLLTAKTSLEQQIEGMKNMADAYITKPFNLRFLQQTLKSLLANRSKLKEHFTGDISSKLKTQTVNKLDRKFMNEFTSLVESNIANDEFGVENICKQLGVSKVQLYKKVKALMNIHVNDYIIDTRLQKARYLLQHEELSIGEVAYKVGFSSPAYFSTVFKSKFGVTPKAFKGK